MLSGLSGLSGLSAVCGGSAAWTPASLPGLALTKLPAVGRAGGKLWQDSGKTIAASADGDPIRVRTDPYGTADLTSPTDARRALLYAEAGGKWSESYDGVDDTDTTPSTSALTLGTTQPFWVGCAVVMAGGSQGAVVGKGDGGTDCWQILAQAAAAGGAFRFDVVSAGVTKTRQAGTISAGALAYCVAWFDGSTQYLQVNGGTPVSQAASGPAVETNVLRCGTRAGYVDVPFAGRLRGFLFGKASLDDASRDLLNTYLASL